MKKLFVLLSGLALAYSGFSQNSAELVSISAPASVAPDATFVASITMTNTGSTSWTAESLYKLGSEIPQDNVRWGVSRIELPFDPVNPGQAATFTTTFTAPSAAGVYNFAWRMVQDGVEWFGVIASTTIKVGSPQFVPGDLVILQAGDGLRPIANTGAPMFLNNFSVSGLSNTFQIAIPVTGPRAILGGNSQFTGMIDLTTDKSSIVVEGYNTNLLAMNLEAVGSPRALGLVSSTGDFTLEARTTKGGSTFRGGVSDGLGNLWSGGQAEGIQYLGTNFSPIQISTLGTGAGTGAIRDLIMVNGRPAFSTSQFPAPGNHGIAIFNNVSPTTAQEPVLIIDSGNAITGATGTPSAKGFCINSNLTIAYLVDLRTPASGGGIYRYNGTGTGLANSWTYAYTLSIADLYALGSFQEVVADFSGANPKIYATAGSGNGNSQAALAGTDLVSAVDTGAASTFTSLMVATPGTTFRGLTFAPNAAPVAPVLSIFKSGSNVIVSWTGGGTLRSATIVNGTYNPVAGSPTSPYTNAPSGDARFYRVSVP